VSQLKDSAPSSTVEEGWLSSQSKRKSNVAKLQRRLFSTMVWDNWNPVKDVRDDWGEVLLPVRHYEFLKIEEEPYS
jgi:hypothetical protein